MSDARVWSTWPAPAKLNLFLHITGRRADGYHTLQTVFRLLDWGDRVHLRMRDDAVIERISPLPDVAAEADLGVRAARMLAATTGVARGVDIRIDKHIPVGAGLGGGSSDAATVLVALNALWHTALDTDTLAALGAQLGADVPVFVRGRSAWAEGIGDILAPLRLQPAWYVLLDPHCSIATGPLFQAQELTRDAAEETIRGFLCGVVAGNAFEPVVYARYPQVAAARDWLAEHAAARLSGSGGTVFAEFANRAEAENVAGRCPARFTARVVRGVDESPLLATVRQFCDGASPSR